VSLPVQFEVLGNPAPQGSKRHVGNGVMIETSKALKPWRSAVADAARDVAEDIGLLDEPMALHVEFRFPMPKSRSKAVRAMGMGPKVSAPDVDKCLRAVGDALKIGGLIRDDALFYEVHASKWEVVGWTGAVIRLEGLG
jgi:crossover junction endodeoxyribonuclease RusA